MKKVLVTNDDGITASGLKSLVEALGKKYEVYVAAPAEQQSAKSMAITFMRPVEIWLAEVPGAKEAYVLDGSPVDCIRWAIDWFAERDIRFDYVFSGINLGANVGIAAYYSGTIGAAREGALAGVHSIALSVGTHQSTHFDYICSLIPKVTDMADSLSPSTVLNVNAPDLPPWKVRGVRIAEVAPPGYAEKYAFSLTGEFEGKTVDDVSWEQNPTFQMHQVSLDGKPSAGHSSEIGPGMLSRAGVQVTDADLKYDLDCMRYGFAAITPLLSRVSDDLALRRLQGRYSSEDVFAIIVDPQENIASGLEMRNRFEGNLSRFASCMKRMDIPVIVTELLGQGRTEPAVRDALSGRRTESIIRRELSAWGSGDFARTMEATALKKVMIAGLETHAAVMQTALDFKRRGYEVTVIEDCCASKTGHDHKIAIERMRYEGCIITTYRAAVMELISALNHPAAASVMRILK